MSSKKAMKKMQKLAFQNIKAILETINIIPKKIKFLINIKNEKNNFCNNFFIHIY